MPWGPSNALFRANQCLQGLRKVNLGPKRLSLYETGKISLRYAEMPSNIQLRYRVPRFLVV